MNKNIITHIAIAVSLLFGCKFTVSASKYNQIANPQVFHDKKILPQPSGYGGERSVFGYDVTIEDNVALVSGLYMGSNYGGAVFVYEFDDETWNKTAALESPSPQGNDLFGKSISLSGNKALIGAPLYDEYNEDNGVVYVYEQKNNSWSIGTKIVASDYARDAEFGHSVFILDNQMVVGSPGKKSQKNEFNAGSVYIFEFDGVNWTEKAQITSSDSERNQRFGTSVIMSEKYLFVGSEQSSYPAVVDGDVYVFEKINDAWVEVQKLEISNVNSGDFLGQSLSLNEERLMIGKYNVFNDHLGAAYIFEHNGIEWVETAHLSGFDVNENGRVGYEVDLSGDFAVIGSISESSTSRGAGLAYVFKYDGNNWELINKLKASDGAVGDDFGSALSISGDHVFIGAKRRSDEGLLQAGGAYAFQLNGNEWVQNQIFTAKGSKYYVFGGSLDMSDSRIIVGASGGYLNPSITGYAFIWEFDGFSWQQTAKLQPSTGMIYDDFGQSVSISGNRVVIGSPKSQYNNGSARGAYVFDYNGLTWSETARLLPSNNHSHDFFARVVDIENNRVVVGAPGNNQNGLFSGAVIVFEYINDVWVETAILSASDGSAYDGFGTSLDLQGDRIAVGAPDVDEFDEDSGAVYIFDFNGSEWVETTKLRGSSAIRNTGFGSDLSLSNDRLLIGAKSHSSGKGRAYIFELIENGWQETAELFGDQGNLSEAFGSSVNIINDRVLIGANGQYNPERALGTVYIFDFDGVHWNKVTRLSSADLSYNGSFGSSVAQSDGWIAAGAPYSSGHGIASGSTYLFKGSLDLIFKDNF